VIHSTYQRNGRTAEQEVQESPEMSACMIGKATLEDFPKEKIKADKPLQQVNMDSFT
jgi:hypothetical protein